jgi:DHA1 family bicyclomycin/chloramphenicol resistance-like MFS transporter
VPGPRRTGIYLPVLRQPRTVGYAFVTALNGGAVLAFVTGSPLVLLGGLHLSSITFGIVFAAVASGIISGAWVSGRLARRGVSPRWPLGLGLVSAPLAALIFCALAAFGRLNLAAMMPLLLTNTFSRGLVSPNAMHAALEPVPNAAGAGSAVAGCLQMLMGSLAGLAVGALYPALGPGAMGVTIAGFSLAALTAWIVVERIS